MSGTAGKRVSWSPTGRVYHRGDYRRSKRSIPTRAGVTVSVEPRVFEAQCGALLGHERRIPNETSEREAIRWGKRPCRRCFRDEYVPRFHEHAGAV